MIGIRQVGKAIRISYVEPTTNNDGSALQDLHSTTIQVHVSGEAMPEVSIPATVAEGGGTISYDMPLPLTPNTIVDIAVAVSAVDLSGNRSQSETIHTVMDWLPPGQVK